MPKSEQTRRPRLRPGDVWHAGGQPYELTRFVMRGTMTGLLHEVPVE